MDAKDNVRYLLKTIASRHYRDHALKYKATKDNKETAAELIDALGSASTKEEMKFLINSTKELYHSMERNGPANSEVYCAVFDELHECLREIVSELKPDDFTDCEELVEPKTTFIDPEEQCDLLLKLEDLQDVFNDNFVYRGRFHKYVHDKLELQTRAISEMLINFRNYDNRSVNYDDMMELAQEVKATKDEFAMKICALQEKLLTSIKRVD